MHWVPGQSKVSMGTWVKLDCSSWRTSWEKRGECGLLWGNDIGSKALGNIQQHAFLLRWPLWQNLAPPISAEKPQGKQQSTWAHSSPPTSTNRLPKDTPGTQLPLISPRDKAPSTIGIRIGSTYQWAGISPSHQKAYSKPPYRLQPQGGSLQK